MVHGTYNVKSIYTIISSVGCTQGIRNLKISGAMIFHHVLKVSRMDLRCDRRQWLELWSLHLVVILMYTDGFKPPLTDGLQSFCLVNNCAIIFYYKVFQLFFCVLRSETEENNIKEATAYLVTYTYVVFIHYHHPIMGYKRELHKSVCNYNTKEKLRVEDKKPSFLEHRFVNLHIYWY